MRKLLLALSAIAAVGITVPLATPAQAERVVIKSGEHHRHWDRGHRKVVVIKRGHRHDGWRRSHASGSKVVIRTRTRD